MEGEKLTIAQVALKMGLPEDALLRSLERFDTPLTGGLFQRLQAGEFTTNDLATLQHLRRLTDGERLNGVEYIYL